MKDLHDYGTERSPLRASSLPNLVHCPAKAFLMYLGELDDSSSAAAETGSLVHALVKAWHEGNFDTTGVAREVATFAREFPLADSKVALAHFAGYANDATNRVKLVLSESKVSVRLKAADDDPTGEPILVNGTLDQVREGPRGLGVWDIKTGRPGGLQMLDAYALQLAAYSLAATELLGQPVRPGGIIRTLGYTTREPGPTHFECPWDLRTADMLLDAVRKLVASIRRGDVTFAPGSPCLICPARGLQNCLPMMERYA